MTRSLLLLFLAIASLKAQIPDWSKEASIPLGSSRENIYQLPTDSWEEFISRGQEHVHRWPVEISGSFIPYEPLKRFFKLDKKNPLKKFIKKTAFQLIPFQSEEGLYDYLGLPPNPNPQEPFPLGASLVETHLGPGLSFGCAACHSGNLFGQTIVGLPNKVTRSHQLVAWAKKIMPLIPLGFYQRHTEATDEEREMFARTASNLKSVETISPPVLGLDTSFSQVNLSLMRRNPDGDATKNPRLERRPLVKKPHLVGPSKPMPWWNVKYKTRWGADGAMVSGNPVVTNLLWNEIGRGTDLKELKEWLENNQETIQELTSTVFASPAPRWTDFFSPESINLQKAKKGQRIFQRNCQGCHGEYVKGWENPEVHSPAEQLATTRVLYHEKTPVIDAGTDPHRYKQADSLIEKLNRLSISHAMKISFEPQEGYVPPPLVGIWARYPYFHNNSIPNLCALLTSPPERPKTFWVGPSDEKKHFDKDCVGYFVGKKTPRHWKKNRHQYYNTRLKGLSNQGHYPVALQKEDKKNLIEFLKTL